MNLNLIIYRFLSFLPGTKESRVKRAAKKSIDKFQKTLDLLDKYDKGEELPQSKEETENQSLARP